MLGIVRAELEAALRLLDDVKLVAFLELEARNSSFGKISPTELPIFLICRR